MSDESDINNALKKLDEEMQNIIDLLPEPDKVKLLHFKAGIDKRRADRIELMKRCHPDDSHWPPHPDCPACQKIFNRLEAEAKELLGTSITEKQLEDKVAELFEKKYLVKNA